MNPPSYEYAFNSGAATEQFVAHMHNENENESRLLGHVLDDGFDEADLGERPAVDVSRQPGNKFSDLDAQAVASFMRLTQPHGSPAQAATSAFYLLYWTAPRDFAEQGVYLCIAPPVTFKDILLLRSDVFSNGAINKNHSRKHASFHKPPVRRSSLVRCDKKK